MFVRPLTEADLPDLVRLCVEHAEYERGWCDPVGLEAKLRSHFLGFGRLGTARVVDGDGELAGFATASEELSTWEGASYLYLDCLYLREAYRGRGLGRELLASIAREAVDRGVANLQWQTPEWNQGAIRFYERLGARAKPKQRFTLEFDSCRALASERVKPRGRFASRPVHSRGVLEVSGWRLKQYEITLDGKPVDEEARAAAEAVIERTVTRPDREPALGFTTLHRGLDAFWLLVDRWTADAIMHDVYFADLAKPSRFAPVPDGHAFACVWELEVVIHERDAFVRHMLDPEDGPRLDEYLADVGSFVQSR